MPACAICGEPIPDGSRACPLCGSCADDFFPMGTELRLDESAKPPIAPPSSIPVGGSYCPACAKVFAADQNDGYCTCGTELIFEAPMAPILDDVPMAPIIEAVNLGKVFHIYDRPDLRLRQFLLGWRKQYYREFWALRGIEFEIMMIVPMAPIIEDSPRGVKPSPGTPCLVLYGPDKQPLQYFALEKDAILIGRLDAVAGNFPDIDLDDWFDRATIRKISRQHALILRSRATSTFILRPLTGNTGTQLETQMLLAMQDYPLRPGHRIILGGVIRLKFEIS